MLNRGSVTWIYRILSCIAVVLVSIFLVDITVTEYEVVPGSVKEETHGYGYKKDEIISSFNYISFKYYDEQGNIHDVETKLDYEPSNTDHYDNLVPNTYYDGVKYNSYPKMWKLSQKRIDRIKDGTFRFFSSGKLCLTVIAIVILSLLWLFICIESFCYIDTRRRHGGKTSWMTSDCQSCMGRHMCPSNEAIRKVNKFAGYADDEIDKNIKSLTEY